MPSKSRSDPHGKGIASLADLSRTELIACWHEYHGTAPPKTITQNLFVRGIAYDLYPDEHWSEQNGVDYLDSVDAVCEQADIITLHAASNDTLITETQIALMRPITVLINCARGHLVDSKAVYHAVKEGKIWGYGLDEIWDLDLPLEGLNIAVSPHVGSDTDMGKVGMQIMSAQAVIDYMHGIKPFSIVNKEVLNSPVHQHLKERVA